MSTTNAEEFDYQDYMRRNLPDPSQVRRGPEPRARRRETKARITIRIDQDVLEQFKQLVPDGQGYQTVINHALREWLAAQGIKELIRKDLSEMVEKMLSSFRAAQRAGSK